MKKLLTLLAVLVIILAVGQQTNLLPDFRTANLPSISLPNKPTEKQTVVYEESVITKVVADSIPSVVTIGIKKTASTLDSFQIDPFNPFSPFKRVPGTTQKIEQNIGSGFIIYKNGLVITNKHVVADSEATYEVITNDKKKYNVEKIYRDSLNDLAILKITPPPGGLKPLTLGDSNKLKLGQLVIAIGTPLGEFTNTVTSGIVSGLGRGITAGSPYENYVERLDNVIQTDAAISAGNSGGPLLNSKGQVIGINTAVSQEGQNIGFAIPSSVINNLITNFDKRGGSFERPYIGVRYKMIDRQTAIMNDIVAGAYVVQVIENSPASKADIQEEDVITEFDGKKVQGTDNQELAKLIDQKKVGDAVTLKIWRNKETLIKKVTLQAYNQ